MIQLPGGRRSRSRRANVAAWNRDGLWFAFDSGDIVRKSAASDEVLAFMNKIAGIREGDEVPVIDPL